MTGAAAAATAYWFGRGLQPAMPGVQSVQPDGLAFSADHPQRDPVTGQKTPGEPGHTRDTQAHTRTHRSQRRTSQATKPCNDTPARPDASTRQPKPETGKPRPTQQQQEQPQARSRPLPAADSEEAAPSEPDHLPPPATGMRVCAKHGAMCTVHPARLPVPTGNLHEARAETPSAPSQGCSHQKAS